jgi:uncharacterized protein
MDVSAGRNPRTVGDLRAVGDRRAVGDLLAEVTPDPERLIGVVVARSTSVGFRLHGERHWRAVAATGIVLASETSGADPRIAFLFGLLHDALRASDAWDPEHGVRGAGLVGRLAGPGHLTLSDDVVGTLDLACRLHPDGHVTDDPTVGACWDADRLQLWRCGTEPEPFLLSTAEARRAERIAWAREALDAVPTCDEILRSRVPVTEPDAH